MVLSTTAAGTISQIARGLSSFFTRSCSEDAPAALSLTSLFHCLRRHVEDHALVPALSSRRTMFAPMRPSPIIPSCMAGSFVR